MSKAKLFLIDGHALCYRCFFAIKGLSTSKGQATNAIFGFIRVLRNILDEFSPDYLAVCFDSKEKTRREEKFAAYKIQRPSMPDDLRSQIPVIKDVLAGFRIPIFEKGGYEADDLIATITKKFTRNGVEVVIVSDDKDMYQLAGDNVKFYNSKSNSILDKSDVKVKLGFEPKHIVDFIALAGDKSDNIPGVAGIGAVGARHLINTYGSLESILNHFDQNGDLKGKEKLIVDQKESACFSKELAILDENVPVETQLSALAVQKPDAPKLFEIFQELEFRKLAQEFAGEQSNETFSMQTVNDVPNLKKLIEQIQKNRTFAFLIETQDTHEKGLFTKGSLYIQTGSKDVVAVDLEKCTVLQKVFESKEIAKITYDLKSKLKVLKRYNVNIAGDVFDVMLAGYLLGASQASFELEQLAWQYLKRSVDGDHQVAKETSVILQLYPILQKDLKEKALLPLFDSIEMPLAYVLYEVEANGVGLDTKLLSRLSRECAHKIDILTKKLFSMAGGEINLNSPKQLSKVLFEQLKLPVIKKTKTGLSTNEAVLTILARQHEFPALVLEYRQLAKLKSTYIDALPKLINPDTGRVHAQFNQTGTETGRLSSSHPNLQNIPIRTDLGRQIRKAIIPSNSSLNMIAADYSQIELRILAHLSQDPGLIKAFKKDEDIHTYTASLIFDIDECKVTREMRNSAKRVNFGIIYGISAFGLANDLNVTQGEAQEFINRYFTRYPAVKRFMDNEIKKCEQNGYVVTLLNRRRYIPEINSKNNAMRQFAQRQAINTPVQGSAADLIKLAMINIQKGITKKKFAARMISTVHDELVFEAPVKEQKDFINLIVHEMEHAVKLSVPVKVDVKVGKNWLDMDKV